MTSMDTLPADQRAVLELVLRRGRSYDEIARLLSIDRAGVRKRALAAFDALGPQTRLTPDRRALIADYLLDALPDGVAEQVREHLLASATERAWARAIASELQGLSEHPLPEIPANGRGSGAKAEPRKPAKRGRALRPSRAKRPSPAAEVPPVAALSNGSPRERRARRPSSRTGGAILLAAAAAVALALVLVFVVFSGGSSHKHPALTAHRGRTGSRTAASSSPRIVAQVNLTPPAGGSSPIGLAEVLSVQGHNGVAIAAQGLHPNSKRPLNRYAVWVYNTSSDSQLLGFAGAVARNGVLRTAGALPANASHYKKLVVTLETKPNPKTPGPIVLQGNLTGL